MTQLAGGTLLESKTGVGDLLASWAELVELLALGKAPEMRACPVCDEWGLRAATRCGFCWTALPPLAPGRDESWAASAFHGG